MIEIVDFESRVLKGNPLGDPTLRKLWVYLPSGYEKLREYPTLLALNGFTGNGAMFFNSSPFSEGLGTRVDRLIAQGKCPPCIVVAPDCYTRIGGSQYLNSSAIGRYKDYLIDEIIPFAKSRWSTGQWGVFGKSSGGFGAMILGMEHPDIFHALANHSGDSNFELAYLPDYWKALDKFKAAGGPGRWLEQFWDEAHQGNRKDIETLEKLAMAACYSPNPASTTLGIDFPFDLETGVFRPEVWARWREWDPVNRIALFKQNLMKLRLIYVDCGWKDEFSLHWGNRAIVAELKRFGAAVHSEEFQDGHMSISYRFDVSVPMLCKALLG